MSKLPVISGKDLLKYLTKKKGYSVVHIRGDHAKVQNNERSFPVPLYDELDRKLLGDILTEAGIEREQFIREWYGK